VKSHCNAYTNRTANVGGGSRGGLNDRKPYLYWRPSLRLSIIVLKLLAKTPEERYQTASGLQADLRKCLEDWESLGHIEPLVLGAHDVSGRLLIPEKLYGRDRELIIGKQAPVTEFTPQEAQNLLQAVLRAFLGVFARKEHPLVLFLDDLQWLDAATVQLLEHLVTHPEVRHLLLIGAVHEMVGLERKAEPLEMLKRYLERLREWADNCPTTFLDKYTLVSAEVARIEGRDLDAMRLYEEAIGVARENAFTQNEGIANELAARFYAGRGFEKIAHAYLRDARYCYLRWGATGKVRQLDELYPQLREEEPVPGPTSTIEAAVEHLDLGNVIKVSQAVSSEIVLEKLIDTLMRTAIEHAGAERGLLILPQGVEQRVEAEATTIGDTIIVRLREAFVAEAEAPESIVHYIMRTQESVILDDALAQNSFSADAYIRRHHARSILGLPLINQAKLIGVLCLENSLHHR
jgi:hypothetical protein